MLFINWNRDSQKIYKMKPPELWVKVTDKFIHCLFIDNFLITYHMDLLVTKFRPYSFKNCESKSQVIRSLLMDLLHIQRND